MLTRFARYAAPLTFFACGGNAVLGGTTGDASADSRLDGNVDPPDRDVTAPITDAGVSASADSGVDSGCANAVSGVLVVGGGTLQPRPNGSVLRLQLVYQDSAVAITRANGVNMTLPGSGGPPPRAGVNSGYWAELRDGNQAVLYTTTFQDPTRIEAPTADGGYVNSVAPRCDPKRFGVDVPNAPSARALVIFGSPYGTQNLAVEIGRFLLP